MWVVGNPPSFFVTILQPRVGDPLQGILVKITGPVSCHSCIQALRVKEAEEVTSTQRDQVLTHYFSQYYPLLYQQISEDYSLTRGQSQRSSFL